MSARLDFERSATALPRIQWQSRFVVDDRSIPTAFGRTLSPLMADLLDVAMAVYVADRLRLRRPRARIDPYRTRWSRDFRVRLPVRHADVWRSQPVIERLERILTWLTEDGWHFEFVQRTEPPRSSETQGFLFETPPRQPVTVGLFSGGLDSLIGAAQLLDGAGGTLVLVSASSSSRLRHLQRQLSRELTGRSRDVINLRVPFNLKGTANEPGEISQRSRGFVFLVLGAVTAATAGTNDLRLFENGIGAMNLPYVECQVGTHSTRSAHPATLRYFADLLSSIGFHLTITNSLFNLTKAEVCSGIPADFLRLIAMSESCDGFPQRVAGTPRCGRCTACLLRALSLTVAGRSAYEDWTKYRMSPLSVLGATSDPIAGAMLYQVGRMRRSLEAPDPWLAAVAAFPSLARIPADMEDGPLGHAIARNELLDLIRRYVMEWEQLPASIGTAA